MKIESVNKPVFQIGHALTTLAMLFSFAAWVVAGDKAQDEDRAQIKQDVTEVKTRQEMLMTQQQKIENKQDKTIDMLQQLMIRSGGQ